MTRVVLATRNAHKVVELRAILSEVCDELGLEIVGLGEFPSTPEVVEDGITFEANAMLKAVAAAKATGLPALADDSGLAVDVLGGSPGIFSARWSGGGDDRANHELLLAQLGDVRDEHRGAAFVCAASLVLPDGRSATELGHFTGRVAREPRGDGGFGYDPVFLPSDQPAKAEGAAELGDSARTDRTLAQFSAAEKNDVSHRARAFRALVPHLKELLRP